MRRLRRWGSTVTSFFLRFIGLLGVPLQLENMRSGPIPLGAPPRARPSHTPGSNSDLLSTRGLAPAARRAVLDGVLPAIQREAPRSRVESLTLALAADSAASAALGPGSRTFGVDLGAARRRPAGRGPARPAAEPSRPLYPWTERPTVSALGDA